MTGAVEHAAEQTVAFEPVAPAPIALPEEIVTVPPSAKMIEAVEELRRRWESVQSGRSAAFSALAIHDTPTPLLPGWGWPMAEPDASTPIYDELIVDMPDPSGVDGNEETERAGAALLNELDDEDRTDQPGDEE